MRNCNKVITVRLTEDEYKRCGSMAKGNKSFYIRQLIHKDITSSDFSSKETIIKIVEDYLAREKVVEQSEPPIKPEQTKMAKQVISDLFNF